MVRLVRLPASAGLAGSVVGPDGAALARQRGTRRPPALVRRRRRSPGYRPQCAAAEADDEAGQTDGGCLRWPQPAGTAFCCFWSGIRTRDTPLARLLYPIELSNRGDPGIEPGKPPTGSPLLALVLLRHAAGQQTEVRPRRTGGRVIPDPWAVQRGCEPAKLSESCASPLPVAAGASRGGSRKA